MLTVNLGKGIYLISDANGNTRMINEGELNTIIQEQKNALHNLQVLNQRAEEAAKAEIALAEQAIVSEVVVAEVVEPVVETPVVVDEPVVEPEVVVETPTEPTV